MTAADLDEQLTDAIYRAALEPDAWDEVMRLLARRFPSSAQTFYFLHLRPRRVRPVQTAGVAAPWLARFDALYFAADNPWIRLTRDLHRPGVVRTNQRLADYLHDAGALYRSAYYNDWMRPQGFKYTLGNTLLAEGGVVANITLLRPDDMREFQADEVAAFERTSRHLTRALRMAMRLEGAQAGYAATGALDALRLPVALVDDAGRLLHANPAFEALLRTPRAPLRVCRGVLQAAEPGTEERLRACIAGGAATADRIALPPAGTLHAVPVTGALARGLPLRPLVLLTIEAARALPTCERLIGCHGFTRAEARLVHALLEGRGLREAAAAVGVSYGTARVYLKAAFEKAGVHSQAQLVARLLGAPQAAGPPSP